MKRREFLGVSGAVAAMSAVAMGEVKSSKDTEEALHIWDNYAVLMENISSYDVVFVSRHVFSHIYERYSTNSNTLWKDLYDVGGHERHLRVTGLNLHGTLVIPVDDGTKTAMVS